MDPLVAVDAPALPPHLGENNDPTQQHSFPEMRETKMQLLAPPAPHHTTDASWMGSWMDVVVRLLFPPNTLHSTQALFCAVKSAVGNSHALQTVMHLLSWAPSAWTLDPHPSANFHTEPFCNQIPKPVLWV
jgi:hypothetical protein